MRQLLARAFVAAALMTGAMCHAQGPGEIRFGTGGNDADQRFDFPRDLLALSLTSPGGTPPAIVSVLGLADGTAEDAVAVGRIDVTLQPMVANDPRLVPVRFPLRRGLLGVRLLLARPDDAEALSLSESAAALARGRMLGYQTPWHDLAALRALGFRITASPTYEGIFALLRNGQVDYLSRSVSEVFDELERPSLAGRGGLVVVPDVALFYPLDDYFFVAAGNTGLADRIAEGLALARRDGRYALLFHQHFGDALRRAGMADRRILHVVDYPVPEGTPLEEFDVLELITSKAHFSAR